MGGLPGNICEADCPGACTTAAGCRRCAGKEATGTCLQAKRQCFASDQALGAHCTSCT